MKNFGLSSLVVVDPQGPAAADLAGETPGSSETARRLAVHAEDTLDGARVVDGLGAAVGDAALVFGTTMRLGQKRKGEAVLPEVLAARAVDAAPGTVAILFGNERFGLSDEELGWASEVVAIPTDPACPSLNLSHAVSVISYLLYRRVCSDDGGAAAASGLSIRAPLDIQSLGEVTSAIEKSLRQIGFQTQEGPQGMRAFLSDVFGRAGLSTAEADRLRKLFASLSGLSRKR